MRVQGASRCGVPCPECSGVCEGLAAACHTRSVVGGMARSLSTPFSAVIMPGCAHGGCLWSHCQVIVTCLTLSGHWQDMLTGKHDLLCKQLLTSCLDQATSRYKRPRRPQTLQHQATALQDHIQALHTACSIHSLSSPPAAFMGRHFMPLSTTTGTFRSSGHTRQHISQHCRALPQRAPQCTLLWQRRCSSQCCLYFWTTLTTWLRIQAAFKAPSLGTGLSALLLGSTALSANVAASSAVAAGRVCALITITRCTAAAPGAP